MVVCVKRTNSCAVMRTELFVAGAKPLLPVLAALRHTWIVSFASRSILKSFFQLTNSTCCRAGVQRLAAVNLSAVRVTQEHCDLSSDGGGWWPRAAAGTGDGNGEGGGARKKCPVNPSLEHEWLFWPIDRWFGGFYLGGEKREFTASGLNSHCGSRLGWSPWPCLLLPEGAEREWRVWSLQVVNTLFNCKERLWRSVWGYRWHSKGWAAAVTRWVWDTSRCGRLGAEPRGCVCTDEKP